MSDAPGTQPAAISRDCKIMVVDDEHAITDLLITILRRYGFCCAPAYDGLQAIEVARQFRPSLIIMGVLMPYMNGVDAAMRISDEQPDCEIIFFSGHAASVDLLNSAVARGYNFRPIVPKPVPAQVLLDLVAESVIRYRSRE